MCIDQEEEELVAMKRPYPSEEDQVDGDAMVLSSPNSTGNGLPLISVPSLHIQLPNLSTDIDSLGIFPFPFLLSS